MNPNNCLFIGQNDGNFKDIPKQYQEFLPENIHKDKYSHPYSYDPFIIYYNEKAEEEANDTIYSDRLLLWDWDKHNHLCEKHFGNQGQLWDNREPEKIEAFLSDFTGKQIVLIANIQYCNISNGYPVWRFDFYYKDKKDNQIPVE